MGKGDAQALQELTVLLTGLQINFTPTFRHVDGLHKENLILLGAEEVNNFVNHLKERYESNFFYARNPLRLVSKKEATEYSSSIHENADEGVLFDYGTIMRVSNAYSQGRTVMAIGGLYGFGTWGGVRLLQDQDFQHRLRRHGGADLECFYRVEVLNEDILRVDVLDFNLLYLRDPHSALPSERRHPHAEVNERQ